MKMNRSANALNGVVNIVAQRAQALQLNTVTIHNFVEHDELQRSAERLTALNNPKRIHKSPVLHIRGAGSEMVKW